MAEIELREQIEAAMHRDDFEIHTMAAAAWAVVAPVLERQQAATERLADFGIKSRERHRAELERQRGQITNWRDTQTGLIEEREEQIRRTVAAENEVERLRAELAEVKAELDQVSVHKGVNCYWRSRAKQAEAERDALKAELAGAEAERDRLKRERAGWRSIAGVDELMQALGIDNPFADTDDAIAVAQRTVAELAEARAAIERTQHLLSTLVYTADVLAALDAPQRPEDTREETGRG